MNSWWGWLPIQILGLTAFIAVAIVLIARLLTMLMPLE